MRFTFQEFDKVDKFSWDKHAEFSIANLNFSTYFIDYQLKAFEFSNLSGLILDGGQPTAIVLNYLDNRTGKLHEPMITPIGVTNRFLLDEFYCDNHLNQENLIGFGEILGEKSRMIYNNWESSEKSLDELKQMDIPGCNLVIDLKKSAEDLWANLSRNHRRNIMKSLDIGQKVIRLDCNSSKKDIEEYFFEYQKYHILVSGKLTRRQVSFDYMKHLITAGVSSLFVAKLAGKSISFLYCDSKSKLSRGWSQVTIPSVGKGIFPRTLLEWTAILHFKSNGFNLYHLGSLNQAEISSTNNLLGFNEFKLRFGPSMRPIYYSYTP